MCTFILEQRRTIMMVRSHPTTPEVHQSPQLNEYMPREGSQPLKYAHGNRCSALRNGKTIRHPAQKGKSGGKGKFATIGNHDTDDTNDTDNTNYRAFKVLLSICGPDDWRGCASSSSVCRCGFQRSKCICATKLNGAERISLNMGRAILFISALWKLV
jgi:hypothetical protein